MRLSIFGLGYVGSVSAACFARDGHEVIGVDVNPLKVEIINSGRSPIVEPQLNELIDEAVKAGRLRATTDAAAAISSSDVSMRSEEHTSELQSRFGISYAVFCLKKK